MRSLTFFSLCCALLPLLPVSAASPAVFDSFTYAGDDKTYRDIPLDAKSFYNPILQGFYPDPSITRKGGDYYLVCSSFSYFPGVPVFHSTDLVNWRQLGHVLSRPSQLRVAGLGISQGIYAPDIQYNPHNDTFYMITTLVGGPAGGNFLVKAKDPAGEWSDPVYLPEVGGIDPSLFFDEDGKGYILHNDAPDGKPRYDGHRAIRLWYFDPTTDKVTGGGKVMVDGGIYPAEKPIWIEGPHLYKKGGKYYIMCAEGGTGPWHSEVILSSEKVDGPYTPAPVNPILTQRHLDEGRPYPVTSAGHADIVSTPDGGHYAVFLACRPYRGNLYNTGRETFLLPVDWSGEFPVFDRGTEPIAVSLPLPAGVKNLTGRQGFLPNGNFSYTDRFRDEKPAMKWLTVRGPGNGFAATGKDGLRLEPLPVSLRDAKATPAFIAVRQQHCTFSAQTAVSFSPASEKELAGVACFQNEGYNYIFGVTILDGKRTLILEKTSAGNVEQVAAVALPESKKALTLKVEGDGGAIAFLYSTGGKKFETLAVDQDATLLSTEVSKGFTGCMIGLYATSAR